MVSIAQCIILKTPNLSGRTALFFYPLFIIVFTCTLNLLTSFKIKIIQYSIAVLVSFSCSYHVSHKYNLKSAREWWFEENTFDILKYLKSQYTDKPIELSTNWLFNNSFYYYAYTGKLPWLKLYDKDYKIDPETKADYYYILSEDYEN